MSNNSKNKREKKREKKKSAFFLYLGCNHITCNLLLSRAVCVRERERDGAEREVDKQRLEGGND